MQHLLSTPRAPCSLHWAPGKIAGVFPRLELNARTAPSQLGLKIGWLCPGICSPILFTGCCSRRHAWGQAGAGGLRLQGPARLPLLGGEPVLCSSAKANTCQDVHQEVKVLAACSPKARSSPIGSVP